MIVRFWLLAVLAYGFGPGLAAPLAAQEASTEAAAPDLPFPGQALAQPSYDSLRIAEAGLTVDYHVVVDWVPVLVTTPDGGGWVFFGAQARDRDASGARRIFASRFDPARGVWLPATAMPGERAQIGPAAVVDGKGAVHLVYSEISGNDQPQGATLLYTRVDPGGGWSAPTPVAADPNAGYQMMPALAVDDRDRLHILWRDQRNVSAEARAALPANADLFAATLENGVWGPPEQASRRESADVNAAWPQLVVESDRLVALWSIYQGTSEQELRAAVRVEWSSRPLDAPAEWSPARVLVERTDDEVGGRLLDVASGPDGVTLVYGRYNRGQNVLALKRLPRGSDEWSADQTLSTGDYGYLPTLAITPGGDAVVAYNTRRNRNVDIGAVAIPNGGAPLPPVLLTPAEDGAQARAHVAIATDGLPWIVYMYQPAGETAVTEIRALRGAALGAD